ncbi:hypothetical protein BYT27DRAFT_7257388 [Phlegmacium glaucopus]|nr:hypothetical protein BYT27DRAFT_7257388 [Phlegmacium glaucopus]
MSLKKPVISEPKHSQNKQIPEETIIVEDIPSPSKSSKLLKAPKPIPSVKKPKPSITIPSSSSSHSNCAKVVVPTMPSKPTPLFLEEESSVHSSVSPPICFGEPKAVLSSTPSLCLFLLFSSSSASSSDNSHFKFKPLQLQFCASQEELCLEKELVLQEHEAVRQQHKYYEAQIALFECELAAKDALI